MWIFEFVEREVVSLQWKNMLNFRFLSLSVSHHIIWGGGGAVFFCYFTWRCIGRLQPHIDKRLTFYEFLYDLYAKVHLTGDSIYKGTSDVPKILF